MTPDSVPMTKLRRVQNNLGSFEKYEARLINKVQNLIRMRDHGIKMRFECYATGECTIMHVHCAGFMRNKEHLAVLIVMTTDICTYVIQRQK